MDTVRLPPKISRRVSSALMFRFSFLSCKLFFLTYAQIFLTTSVRGSGRSPVILARAALGVSGFMNAAFGLRADFLAGFFAAFFAAIVGFSSWMGLGPLPKPDALCQRRIQRVKPFLPRRTRSFLGGPTNRVVCQAPLGLEILNRHVPWR